MPEPEYKGLISQFTKLYEELEPFAFATDYHNEAINANEILRLAGNITSAIARNSKMTPEVSANNIRQLLENFYKDYHLPVDKRSFIAIVNEYKKNVPLEMQPEFFKDIVSKKGSVEAVADCLFEASLFASREKALNAIKDGVTETTFAKDPAVLLYNAFNEKYKNYEFYKLLNKDLTHYGYTYKDGLNMDVNEFNPKGECSKGGLYFTEKNKISMWMDSYSFITKCVIPNDAKVYVEASGVQYRKWIEENHDCDNFSLALLGYWSEGLYSFAFGYARSKTHAFNVMINEKTELWICEPQDNKWYQYDFFLKINSEQYKITEVLM